MRPLSSDLPLIGRAHSIAGNAASSWALHADDCLVSAELIAQSWKSNTSVLLKSRENMWWYLVHVPQRCYSCVRVACTSRIRVRFDLRNGEIARSQISRCSDGFFFFFYENAKRYILLYFFYRFLFLFSFVVFYPSLSLSLSIFWFPFFMFIIFFSSLIFSNRKSIYDARPWSENSNFR